MWSYGKTVVNYGRLYSVRQRTTAAMTLRWNRRGPRARASQDFGNEPRHRLRARRRVAAAPVRVSCCLIPIPIITTFYLVRHITFIDAIHALLRGFARSIRVASLPISPFSFHTPSLILQASSLGLRSTQPATPANPDQDIVLLGTGSNKSQVDVACKSLRVCVSKIIEL